jgi:hypothetical protein
LTEDSGAASEEAALSFFAGRAAQAKAKLRAIWNCGFPAHGPGWTSVGYCGALQLTGSKLQLDVKEAIDQKG